MKLKKFVPFVISVLMIFQVCVPFAFADEDPPEKIPQRIMDLANHKIRPKNDDPNSKVMLNSKDIKGLISEENDTILDVVKISENKDSEIFEATVIVTRAVLNKYEEDILADVKYFVKMTYDKRNLPDGYPGYKITNVSGGVISKSDPQMTPTKLYLRSISGYSRYLNATGNRTSGIEKFNSTTWNSPKMGSTYSFSPSSNYYYDTSGAGGINAQAHLTVKRSVSSATWTDYVDVFIGTRFGLT
ncbi:TPA: hypothetical protein KO474_000629 [Clostridioides difficile]|uniref:hypothetical protein n=1 Tax=Clostridioides difficile TaxID=1496 RepID=UPI00093C0F39|nr:hypothetical protein [Clostridioides difficile]MBN5981696.1 hypothetical protein [Clostridioides difficile]UWI48501.1 hypothetical protein NZ312_10280 [Clostridioides difficile]HBE9437025.1 hypothetical protein [Clostridioides difficile]HBF9318829.1 hypothetical protein [Clostridioides difficile]HEK4785890.1 hypothetical protein [Clostridioides difficile]